MKYAVVVADTFALGPAYLISHLRAAGHEVKLIFDPLHHSCGGTKKTWLSKLFSVESYNINQIKKFKPDAVIFSVITAHYQWAVRLARKIKVRVGCKIIIGGIHVRSVPLHAIDPVFDTVVQDASLDYFGITFDPDRIFPEREDFYKELPPCHREHPFIMTEFGCPFSCTYCLPRHLKTRHPKRTIDGCIRELKWLKAHGARRVSIWDDTFTHDKDWLINFLIRYIDEVGLPFRCLTHPKFVDPVVVGALKEAGCYTIDMGIQTGNAELRRKVLNRHETNEEFLRACRLIKAAGIKLVIDHIFEIPGESDETNEESYQLYKIARPDLIHCFKLLYFPGAKIIDEALRVGRLTPEDVKRIEEGRGVVYASGEHNRVARVNKFCRRMLAIPIGGGASGRLPDWLIKFIAYIRIGEDFLPQTIIQQHIYWTWRRLCKIR